MDGGCEYNESLARNGDSLFQRDLVHFEQIDCKVFKTPISIQLGNIEKRHLSSAPYNVTSIPDVYFHAGEYISFIFHSSVFQDNDGDVLSYSSSSSPDISSWLNFDPAENRFYANTNIVDAGIYIITVIADDADPTTANGTTSFTLNLDAGLDSTNMKSIVGQPFTYAVPAGAFGAAEGTMTDVDVAVVPNTLSMSYDLSTRVASGMVGDNTLAGTYSVNLTAFDDQNTELISITFNLEYVNNLLAVVGSQLPALPTGCIEAYTEYSYSIPKTSIIEPEGETTTVWLKLVDNSGLLYWLYLKNNSTHYIMNGVPSNEEIGNFTILGINMEDTLDQISFYKHEGTLCVNQNPNYLNNASLELANGTVGLNYEFIFNKSDALHSETVFEALVSPDFGWLSCNINATHVTCSGVPSLNDYHNVKYKIIIMGRQSSLDTQYYTYEYFLLIKNNEPPVLALPGPQSVKVPDGIEISLGNDWVTDPENLPLNVTLKLDNKSPPAWIHLDSAINKIIVTSTDNSFAGNHKIKLSIKDGYSGVVSDTIEFQIIKNEAPVLLKNIEDYK